MAYNMGIILEMSAIPFEETEQKAKPFSCNVCQRCFSGIGFLKAHFQRAHHKSPFPLLPSYGTKSVPIKESASSHKTHPIINSKQNTCHSCDICSKVFPKKIDLIKHEFMHRTKHGFPHIHVNHIAGKSLKCPQCKSLFIYKKDFKTHTSTKCEMCCKFYCTSWFSKKSICKTEEKECSLCKRDLCERCHQLHQTSPTPIAKIEVECVVCKMVFTEKRCLKDHYARAHSIIKLSY